MNSRLTFNCRLGTCRLSHSTSSAWIRQGEGQGGGQPKEDPDDTYAARAAYRFGEPTDRRLSVGGVSRCLHALWGVCKIVSSIYLCI
jgi:hypothetical protein